MNDATAKIADAIVREAVGEPLVLSPNAPLESARALVQQHFMHNDERTLHHQQDAFYAWHGSHYREIPKEQMRSLVYKFLDGACRMKDGKDGKLVPFDPNETKVRNVLLALAAETQLPVDARAPAWIDGKGDDPPAAEVLPCQNGLLHLPTGQRYEHSPGFFNLHALDYAYQPRAPEPKQWKRFLHDLWGDDREAIRTLQEFFGLFLTADTSFQKMLLLIGPKRSGKGTIARILTLLIGRNNVAAPTLSSLTQHFGLVSLIDKTLGIISDARFSGRGGSVALERLLNISGEDVMTIDRKYQSAWTGRLPTRIMICTNELPKIRDSSGALASRFIVLALTRDFYGREDRGLLARLQPELPGILNWGIEGYRRLIGRGHFIQPASGQEAADQLADLASRIGTFLRDRCVVGKGYSVRCDDLFNAWEDWCEDQGNIHPGDVASFGRDLRAAMPQVSKRRPREGRERPWEYAGQALRRELERYADD